jgi:hypothetical protein
VKLYKPRFNQREETPEGALKPNPVRRYATCNCLSRMSKWQELTLHDEIQDTQSDAWKSLEAYILKVAADGSDELNPMAGIGPEKWEQIITLPASIWTLQSVKVLNLYGSHLVRIPPEIGEMTNLEEFDAYTSYQLHWFPFEITRCKKLRRSRVSTRAVYGNYKYRPPFPRLPIVSRDLTPASCSVCHGPFTKNGPNQMWVSLAVATDALPLLVHACSENCIQQLPAPARGYTSKPHQGGLDVEQPPARYRCIQTAALIVENRPFHSEPP